MEEKLKIEKTKMKIFSLGEEPKDCVYWLSQAPQKRLEAVEYLRELNYTRDEIKSRLQRVCRIVKLSQS